ncbi:hypothetical protein BACCAP_00714 [Pseudoflavonifractor capillosus ATCC 29799]|uniref:Uncharacterized protein n=1 Tax=Pseudoflavonifractor capillosus ATCC 29799 TaxID=411467 RepID=A6NR89_9FIRM|nr:hypothetical protein BACCAP_00714 [Pseudoflavonifractor capillosus ATCC 29799]
MSPSKTGLPAGRPVFSIKLRTRCVSNPRSDPLEAVARRTGRRFPSSGKTKTPETFRFQVFLWWRQQNSNL